MARLTDDELLALTDAEMQDAQSYCGGNGKLATERQRAEYYFHALPKGDLAPPEIEGRSSVVDTTVRNTVLGMHAPLVKVFCGTENVVEFAATQPSDEEKAKQATEYLNYLLRKKCSGYEVIYTWIFDALKSKKGFIKVWWDDTPIVTEEEYTGLTIEQVTLMLDDDEVEVKEQKAYEDEDAAKAKAKQLEQMQAQLAQMAQAAMQDPNAAQQAQQAQAQFEQFAAQPVPMLYDITLKRTKANGKLCVENVPPEEMFVSRSCKHIDDETFKAHKVLRTIGQLKASGYKNVDSIQTDDAQPTPESVERDQFGSTYALTSPSEMQDPDSRRVWLEECYMHGDLDGSGRSLFKVVRAGGQILEREKVDANPFVDLASIPLPHQYFGLSPADLAMQAQRIKTSLKRVTLDNMYLQVNGRTIANPEMVNIDDLLNSRPGGVVRVKGSAQVGMAVAPLQQGMSDMGSAMTMLEATEIDAEESTGWTRQTQGGNMQVAQTATQSNIVTNRADSRVEMIARTMAETGFTLLFKKMLRLVTRHQNKAEQVRLSGGWADVDPREWNSQFDLTINVGLGTGNKDQQVAHLGMLFQQQMAGLPIGIVTPENIYNSQKKLTEALGFKSADAFFTDPSKMPPKQPQQDPAIVKAQLDDQAHQREMQLKQQQAQMDTQLKQEAAQIQAQAQMQIDQFRQQAEAEKHALKLQYEAQFNQMKEQNRVAEREQEIAFQQYKLDREIDAKIVIAQIAAKQQQDAALQAAEQQANEDVAADGNA
jgi:hypothetical protein